METGAEDEVHDTPEEGQSLWTSLPLWSEAQGGLLERAPALPARLTPSGRKDGLKTVFQARGHKRTPGTECWGSTSPAGLLWALKANPP